MCEATPAELGRLMFLLCSGYLGTLPIITFAAVGALVALLIGALAAIAARGASPIITFAGLCWVTGFIAVLAGYATGNARETVVGDVVPVLLSGVGALFVYAVLQKTANAVLTSGLTLSFATTFYVGLEAGSEHRAEVMRAQTSAQIAQSVEVTIAPASVMALAAILDDDAPKLAADFDLGNFVVCPEGTVSLNGECVALPNGTTGGLGETYNILQFWEFYQQYGNQGGTLFLEQPSRDGN